MDFDALAITTYIGTFILVMIGLAIYLILKSKEREASDIINHLLNWSSCLPQQLAKLEQEARIKLAQAKVGKIPAPILLPIFEKALDEGMSIFEIQALDLAKVIFKTGDSAALGKEIGCDDPDVIARTSSYESVLTVYRHHIVMSVVANTLSRLPKHLKQTI